MVAVIDPLRCLHQGCEESNLGTYMQTEIIELYSTALLAIHATAHTLLTQQPRSLATRLEGRLWVQVSLEGDGREGVLKTLDATSFVGVIKSFRTVSPMITREVPVSSTAHPRRSLCSNGTLPPVCLSNDR